MPTHRPARLADLPRATQLLSAECQYVYRHVNDDGWIVALREVGRGGRLVFIGYTWVPDKAHRGDVARSHRAAARLAFALCEALGRPEPGRKLAPRGRWADSARAGRPDLRYGTTGQRARAA